MSSYDAKAKLGTRVRQGQIIGYVGMTGLATANHLHYEYRLNGVHRNPRTVSLPDAEPIADKYRAQFLAEAAPILEELESFKSTQIASIAYNVP
jgi:murein DD-endopeptidase MepM/ murein hydrolase activator NlpD